MRLWLVIWLLLLSPLCDSYGEIQFDLKHTQTIRRKDFYEITAGSKAYFILYYLDEDPNCVIWAKDWNYLAEDFASNEGIVFLQACLRATSSALIVGL